MAIVYYKHEEHPLQAIFPRSATAKVFDDPKFGIPPSTSQLLLKTMATTRFEISGSDAEDALESNIEDCMDKFVYSLNQMLASCQLLTAETHLSLSSAYDRNAFDYLYILMQGKDSNTFGHNKLALNLSRVALNPQDLANEKADKLLSLLSGVSQLDEIQLILHSSKNAIDGGLLKYALLQLVIAGEIATASFVKTGLLAKGVSNNKWNDHNKDITYSSMLNLYLWALTPAHNKPNRQTIGTLNMARSCRNDLMHEGKFDLSKDTLRTIYTATVDYVDYISKLKHDLISPSL